MTTRVPTRPALAARELAVLELMAAGQTNKAIAEMLFISPKTVERHVNSIFIKLDLALDERRNRRVLAVLAYLDRE